MRTISKLLCILFLCITINFSEAQNEIQRVRIDFTNPDGYTRHLLLGFVPDNSATDGFDYGYDALNIDNLADDLNWIIEDDRYVIQGVGEFNVDKYYPLGMFLSNSGDISISLNALENFDDPIEVYLYDLELNTYTPLNSSDYINNLSANSYLERFYVTFSNVIGSVITANSVLSIDEDSLEDIKVWHSNINDELSIKGVSNKNDAVSVTFHTIEGKPLIEEEIFNTTNNVIKLNTLGFSEGVYILTINSTSFSYTTKVCIAN